MADSKDFIPYPTVSPTGAPSGDREQVSISSDMFGGQVGAAEEKLGEAISGAGRSIVSSGLQVLAKQNEQRGLQNQIATADTSATAISKLDDIYGNYSQLNGRDAIAGHDQYKADINKTISDAIASAPDLKSKAELTSFLRGQTSRYVGLGRTHLDSETNIYDKKTMVGRADSFANSAVLSYSNNDFTGFDDMMNRSVAVVAEYTKKQGLGPETINALGMKQRGEVVLEAAKIDISQGKLDQAQKLLDHYKDKIDAKSITDISDALKQPLKRTDVRNAVDGLMGTGAPLIDGGQVRSAPAGTRPLSSNDPRLAPVRTADGRTFMVLKQYQRNFQGFITDYEHHGGVIGPNTDTLGDRPNNGSYHPIGAAIDINQTGRGIRGGGVSLPPAIEDQLAAKWGLRSGNHFANNDNGHFDAGVGGGRGGGGAAGRLGGGSGFISALGHFESSNSNVTNVNATTTSGRARGWLQITDGTWADFGGLATGYKTAQDAPYAVQIQIGSKIPMGRWAPETLDKMRAAGFRIDPSKTMGENAIMNGGSIGNIDGQVIPANFVMRPQEQVLAQAINLYGNDPDFLSSIIADIHKRYSLWHDLNETKISELNDNVPKMISGIEDGSINIDDPSLNLEKLKQDIMNYVPDKAEQWIREIESAKYVGMLVEQTKFSSKDEGDQALAALRLGHGAIYDWMKTEAAQNPDGTELFRLSKMASDKLAKTLDDREQKLNGRNRDPASYVQTERVTVGPLWTNAWNSPEDFTKYMHAAVSLESKVGTAGDNISLLPSDIAQRITKSLQSNVSSARAVIDKLRGATGEEAWPLVYRDLVKLGGLTMPFQTLANLPKPDAETYAKALQESIKEPKTGWDERLSPGDPKTGKTIKNGFDAEVARQMQPYDNSLRQSGISEQDIESLNAQVRLLAYGNKAFKNDDNAVANAVDAFVGSYDYMPQGGARIPKYDQLGGVLAPIIKQNAETLRSSLGMGDIYLPNKYAGFLGPGMQAPGLSDAAYLEGIKSNSEWVTASTGDKLFLRGPDNRYVRAPNGQPIAVLFRGSRPYENFEVHPLTGEPISKPLVVGRPDVPEIPKPPPIPPSLDESAPGARAAPEIPRIGVTDKTAPGGATNQDSAIAGAHRNALQVYENSLTQSGHFTPKEIEDHVQKYMSDHNWDPKTLEFIQKSREAAPVAPPIDTTDPKTIDIMRSHAPGPESALLSNVEPVSGTDMSAALGKPTVTIQKNDTLEAIAKRELGDGKRWREIAKLNGIKNPRNLKIGSTLVMPEPVPLPRERPVHEQNPQATTANPTQDLKDRLDHLASIKDVSAGVEGSPDRAFKVAVEAGQKTLTHAQEREYDPNVLHAATMNRNEPADMAAQPSEHRPLVSPDPGRFAQDMRELAAKKAAGPQPSVVRVNPAFTPHVAPPEKGFGADVQRLLEALNVGAVLEAPTAAPPQAHVVAAEAMVKAYREEISKGKLSDEDIDKHVATFTQVVADMLRVEAYRKSLVDSKRYTPEEIKKKVEQYSNAMSKKPIPTTPPPATPLPEGHNPEAAIGVRG